MTNVCKHRMKEQLGAVFIGMHYIASAQSPWRFLEVYVKFVKQNDTGPGYF